MCHKPRRKSAPTLPAAGQRRSIPDHHQPVGAGFGAPQFARPAEDLPHVFERFYRVEKSRDRALGGAGIGLAIVKQLVEGWGGRVGAESAAGRTRFWFSLPQGRSLSGGPR